MAYTAKVMQHHKLIALTTIGLFCLVAAAVRLAFIGFDLPWAAGGDEHFYLVWARAIRHGGSPTVENGSGYPPGYLYVYAGEQILVDKIMDSRLRPEIDYVLFGRVANALLGATCVALFAWLTWSVSSSSAAGLVAAAITTGYRLTIQEDRRAAPNTLWLALTLLAFIFLVESIREKPFVSQCLKQLRMVNYCSGRRKPTRHVTQTTAVYPTQ